eukprot:scaffold38834_cov33-Attheya_sp.AAC.2
MNNGAAVDQEAQELLLKATEGKGLSDQDVQKATKILLYAPRDIDVPAQMISVFACLLQCMFGKKSLVVLAVMGGCPISMPTRCPMTTLPVWMLCSLPRCADSLTNRSSSIWESHQQIVLGTFTMHGVSPILSKQIIRSRLPLPAVGRGGGGPALANRPPHAGKRNDHPEYDPRGRPISNPDHPSSWRVTVSNNEFTFFLKKMCEAPQCWGSGIPACANYWIRGVCRANCPREASHQPLVGVYKPKLFDNFVRKTREDFKEQETP